MKIKHSKFKNTAIIYESLVRQLLQDTIGGKESPSIDIIKKYFGKTTELNKELGLYKGLLENKFDSEYKAGNYVDRILDTQSRLDSNKLRKQKYNLIKEIQEYYNVDEFFKSKIGEYKSYASIYKIFTYDISDNTDEIMKCKFYLIESMIGKLDRGDNQDDFEIYRNQDSDIRTQSYKILVESFNKKYSILNDNQKILLREYIQNPSGIRLQKYVVNSAKDIAGKLDEKLEESKLNDIMRIKLTEVRQLLCKFKNVNTINENNIYSLLKYYDLIDELNKIEGK